MYRVQAESSPRALVFVIHAGLQPLQAKISSTESICSEVNVDIRFLVIWSAMDVNSELICSVDLHVSSAIR